MPTIYYAKSLDEEIREYKPIDPIFMTNSKLSPLQRWLDSTIDLDKIAVIHDAYHINRTGYGGHFSAIYIELISGDGVYKEWSLEHRHKIISKEEYDKSPSYPNSKIGDYYYKYTYTIQEDMI